MAIKFAARGFSTSCGIVGYPNIGKSTLFNALSQTQQAQASNYPFCTIDPNVAKFRSRFAHKLKSRQG